MCPPDGSLDYRPDRVLRVETSFDGFEVMISDVTGELQRGPQTQTSDMLWYPSKRFPLVHPSRFYVMHLSFSIVFKNYDYSATFHTVPLVYTAVGWLPPAADGNVPPVMPIFYDPYFMVFDQVASSDALPIQVLGNFAMDGQSSSSSGALQLAEDWATERVFVLQTYHGCNRDCASNIHMALYSFKTDVPVSRPLRIYFLATGLALALPRYIRSFIFDFFCSACSSSSTIPLSMPKMALRWRWLS